jgi:hypothetical protein
MSKSESPIKFHIHIDASEMSEEFYQLAKEEYHFFDQNFSEDQDLGASYRVVAPKRHITRRFFQEDQKAFYDTWEKIAHLASMGGMVGYIEGEYIVFDRNFIKRPFKGSAEPPFKLELRSLKGPPNEQFRKTELHLVMDEDASDPQLIQNLLDTGMYPARMQKQATMQWPAHNAIVFTVQGFYREISKLAHILTIYLNEIGGSALASLKEERIIRYNLFGITHHELPEVIDKIVHVNQQLTKY